METPSTLTSYKKPVKNINPISSKIICSGRRKSSIANIQFFPLEIKDKKQDFSSLIIVNSLKLTEYFPEQANSLKIIEPLKITDLLGKVKIIAKIIGGGKTGQSEALRHAISRAIVINDENCRSVLKLHNYLTRDSRVKERKKPGLKKARKAPQFAKR